MSQIPGLHPTFPDATKPLVEPSPPAQFGPPRRRCSHCRQLFAGHPTFDPCVVQDWWLCPACRGVLLGCRRSRRFDPPLL